MYKSIVAFLLLLTFSAQAQQPELKGGFSAFIAQNIIYPPYALHNCLQGTVNVGFKLKANGDVYEAKVSKGFGIDLDDEALRLVKLTTKKWIVPLQHDTTTVLVVPVNFVLKGYDCEWKTDTEIELAINAYKQEQALIEVVSNFYKQKAKGSVSPQDEAKILRIKTDLDMTDEYLEEVLDQGLKKIKQGDVQGACADFNFVKNMGSDKADLLLAKYCN